MKARPITKAISPPTSRLLRWGGWFIGGFVRRSIGLTALSSGPNRRVLACQLATRPRRSCLVAVL